MPKEEQSVTTEYCSNTDQIPVQIGRYRIQSRIGAGGMGTVFRAIDPSLDRIVAIKIPHFHQKQNSAQASERFLREARAAAQVHHPNVCPIHDLGEYESAPYLVLPYLEGPNLADVLKSGKRFTDEEAVSMCFEIVDGLSAIHQKGIIHRDLKPANILLRQDTAGNMHPLITDFGLARPAVDQNHLTLDGTILARLLT